MLARTRIIFFLGLAVVARGQSADEYQVKAAFLYNLAKFVEWPPESFKTSTDPMTVCILGSSPITDALEVAVKGKALSGRSFAIQQISDLRQTGNCKILFVSASEQKRLHSILLEIKGDGVLTVGEVDTFIEEGGIVNFKLVEGTVRLQINVSIATQRHLQISSRLLSLAQIVKN